MELKDWMKLKNGTDVRGTASEGVPQDPVTLTNEVVTTIAKAFAAWLKNRLRKSVVNVAVGYDSRISAPRLLSCVQKGITFGGDNVTVCGLASTPSMFMILQKNYGLDGSVMLTASHLPFQKNGLKFFVKEGGLEGSDVAEILTLAYEGKFSESKKKGVVTNHPFLDEYSADLVKILRSATGEEKPLRGKRIVVDAGNGAGGFYAKNVLVPLGADITGSQFLEPDGTFPNHIPNPENKQAMASVCKAVKDNHADFGIIFDTDVDRAGAVGKDGEEINRNRLIALICAILLQEEKGITIVTDSVTSDGLKQFITKHGGVHHRFKRGYKNVINEAKRLCENGQNAPLAIETSGHAALKENYFLDDGAYLVTRLLMSMAKLALQGKELTSLIDDLPTPKEEAELRPTFKDPDSDFKALGEGVLKKIEAKAIALPYITLAEDNYEGVRMNFDKAHGDGWALVRMSLHEPIMPVNVESNSVGGAKVLVSQVYELLREFDFLNLTAFENY